jgi:hypothetical protein
LIKLIEGLVASRDHVDRVLVMGEAIPRLERLKWILRLGLVAAVLILSAGYMSMHSQLEDIRSQQAEAEDQRKAIIARLEELQPGSVGK